MVTIETLIASIENRLEDLYGEIDVLQTARSTLTTPSRAHRPAASRSRTARSRRSVPARPSEPTETTNERGSAAAAGEPPARTRPRVASKRPRRSTPLSAETLEQVLTGAERGVPTSELADQTGAPRARVLALLTQLEQSGRIRRDGNRRSTAWHLITDEQRIAQRAAELEQTRRVGTPATANGNGGPEPGA
jgi:predicted Rossmann fold nucleotide-binding protein DprA/Smf involved in DNA uptake